MPAKTKPKVEIPGKEQHRRQREKNRVKLSTTVAAENFAFLQSLAQSGQAGSFAEAIDLAIENLRRTENRLRLERATAAYFDGLGAEAGAEEDALATRLQSNSGEVNFDLEP